MCSLCCSPLKSLQFIPISRVLVAILCNKTCAKTLFFLRPRQQKTRTSFNFPPKNTPQVHPPRKACVSHAKAMNTPEPGSTPSQDQAHFHHQMGKEVVTGSVIPQQRLETNSSGGAIPSCLYASPIQKNLTLLTNINRIGNIIEMNQKNRK